MIDIIIPVYSPRPYEGLNRCIQSVIDNTTDYNLIISASDKSQVYNINQGLERAKSEFIAILDWDVYVTPLWADNLIGTLKEDIGIVGPKMVGSYNGLNSQTDEIKEWPTLAGGCMVFKNIGLKWDDKFPSGYWADTDFCRQYKSKGYKVYINGSVVVEHDIHSSKTNASVTGYMNDGSNIYRDKWGDNEL